MTSFRKFLLLSLIFFSCQKEEIIGENQLTCPVKAVSGSQNKITGSWQLVRIKFPMTGEINDISCNNVIFHFKKNNSLDIENDTLGYSSITNNYDFNKNKKIIKLGNVEYRCTITKFEMILDSSPLDGEIMYFARIK